VDDVATDCLVVDRATGYVTAECLVGWNVLWQSGYMAKKGVTTVTDGIGDGCKISCRGEVFVPDELVPFLCITFKYIGFFSYCNTSILSFYTEEGTTLDAGAMEWPVRCFATPVGKYS